MVLKHQFIADEIGESINKHELRPRTVLDVAQLSAQFECNDATIRKALKLLHKSRLVLAPQRQYEVADGVSRIGMAMAARQQTVGDQELWDMLALRRTLEGMAARLAAERFDNTADYAQDFEATRQRLLAAAGDEDKEIEADLVFHDQIYTLAGSRVLQTVLKSLRTELRNNIEHNVRRLYEKDGYVHENRDGHIRLFWSIWSAIPDEAERRAIAHIDFATRELRQLMGSQKRGMRKR